MAEKASFSNFLRLPTCMIPGTSSKGGCGHIGLGPTTVDLQWCILLVRHVTKTDGNCSNFIGPTVQVQHRGNPGHCRNLVASPRLPDSLRLYEFSPSSMAGCCRPESVPPVTSDFHFSLLSSSPCFLPPLPPSWRDPFPPCPSLLLFFLLHWFPCYPRPVLALFYSLLST